MHKSRSRGLSGLEPISVSEMIQYATHFGLPVKRFIKVVQILDDELLKLSVRKTGKDNKPDKGSKKGKDK